MKHLRGKGTCGLIQAIFGSSEIKESKVKNVLETLTPREERIVRDYIFNGKTIIEIGMFFDLTRSRIYQIYHKALRKLRHPKRTRLLLGAPIFKESEIKILTVINNLDEIKKLSIKKIPLSFRSENALLMAGLETVGELLEKSENDLLKLRNFGRKCLREVNESLFNIGLTLKK